MPTLKLIHKKHDTRSHEAQQPARAESEISELTETYEYVHYIQLHCSLLIVASPLENAPAAIKALRRPHASDKYYSCNEDKWLTLVTEAQDADKKKAKVAMNNLRKFDAAGRIEETDEGKDADVACSWCAREGNRIVCRVWKDKEDKACAFCKRNGKAGCAAGGAAAEAAAEEKTEIEALKDKITSLEESASLHKKHIKKLKSQVETLEGDNKAIWKRMLNESVGDRDEDEDEIEE